MEGLVNFQPRRGPRHDLIFHGDDAETDLVSPESPDNLVIKPVRLLSTEMSPPLQERIEACPLGDAGPIRAWVNDPDRMRSDRISKVPNGPFRPSNLLAERNDDWSDSAHGEKA